MNKNETLTLWLSIGASLFAVILIYSYTQQKSAEISKTFGAQTSVVVAKQLVREMETVQEDMLELKQVPENFIQPGVASHMEEVIGLVALAPLNKGEQILKNKVIKPGPETGLSLQVAPGKRAVTLPANNDLQSLAKLLKPGDRIDIFVSINVGSGVKQEKHIKALLQDVIILATGKNIVNEIPRIYDGGDSIENLRRSTKFNTITVEVDPFQSRNLIYVLATDPSSFFYTLRHPSDKGIESFIQTLTKRQVLGATFSRKPAQKKK